MKSLIKNYLENLSLDKIKEFAYKHNINITDDDYIYILDLVKNNFDDILKDESKYFELLKDRINESELLKLKKLFSYYKERYKGYLF